MLSETHVTSIIAIILAVGGFIGYLARTWLAFSMTNQTRETDARIEKEKRDATSNEKMASSIEVLALSNVAMEKRIAEKIDQVGDSHTAHLTQVKEKLMDEISERRYILLTEKVREKLASSPGV